MNEFYTALQLFGHVGTEGDKTINDTDSEAVKTAKAFSANQSHRAQLGMAYAGSMFKQYQPQIDAATQPGTAHDIFKLSPGILNSSSALTGAAGKLNSSFLSITPPGGINANTSIFGHNMSKQQELLNQVIDIRNILSNSVVINSSFKSKSTYGYGMWEQPKSPEIIPVITSNESKKPQQTSSTLLNNL